MYERRLGLERWISKIMKRDSKFIAVIVFCQIVLCGFSNPHPPSDELSSDVRADKVLVEKSKHRLILFREGKPLKTYRIALGRHPIGPKQREGDQKTPEGVYRIDSKNSNSNFHLALHISYPNPSDLQRAKELGVSPGGNIMIHGITNGLEWVGRLHRIYDWTAGCIAVTDSEIEELWRAVPVGTPVEIDP
jgi:murein L,D-transpeptidase YafK